MTDNPTPAEPPIKWTPDGDKTCGYNNWLGETPFGRILITWKGWKEDPDACVDEFPGGFNSYGAPDDVKAACEAEFARRAALATPAAAAEIVPLTDERLLGIVAGHAERPGGYTLSMILRDLQNNSLTRTQAERHICNVIRAALATQAAPAKDSKDLGA